MTDLQKATLTNMVRWLDILAAQKSPEYANLQVRQAALINNFIRRILDKQKAASAFFG